MTVKPNPEFLERMRKAAAIGVLAGAEMVREKAIDLVRNSPKSGTEYRRRGVVRKRSAPGEPYASDTGNTINQIQEPKVSENGLRATVVFGGVTARRLELGTEKMEPRPVAVPAIAATKEAIEARIKAEIAAEFKPK